MLINGLDIEIKYDVYVINLEISPPIPRTNYVTVPGRDGVLDLTESLGVIVYENRDINIELASKERWKLFLEKLSIMQGDLQGKIATFVPDENTGDYFKGRITVNPNMAGKGIQKISLTLTAEPYRYKAEPTVVEITGTGQPQEIILNNWQKKVAPKITTTADTAIVFNGITYNVGIGMYTLGFFLEAGENILEITTTGTATFEYQERGF